MSKFTVQSTLFVVALSTFFLIFNFQSQNIEIENAKQPVSMSVVHTQLVPPQFYIDYFSADTDLGTLTVTQGSVKLKKILLDDYLELLKSKRGTN